MNFFFGFKNQYLSSSLTIPKFSFNGKKLNNYELFLIKPKNTYWEISKPKYTNLKNFFFIDNSQISNKSLYFIFNKSKIFNKKKIQKLENFDRNFDEDLVAFRANFNLYLNKKTSSSYQSDYSFQMTEKKGNILSPIFPLFNKKAKKNFIIFRNIYVDPIVKKFKYYFIDYKKKKILNFGYLNTNESNIIKVENKYIDENTYFFTDKYLGIPIFVSINNNQMSLEHTHPPHQYIIGNNAFKVVSQIKKEFLEIIS